MKNLLLLIVVLFAVVLRVDSLRSASTHEASPELIRACQIAERAALGERVEGSESGDTVDRAVVQTLRFDPNAWVVVTNGGDGQPGKADVDDDFNGVVDDASERGAFGSDDQCEVLSVDATVSPTTDPAISVLSRGGFVPVQDPQRLQSEDSPRRLIVSGEASGKSWTFAIDVPR